MLATFRVFGYCAFTAVGVQALPSPPHGPLGEIGIRMPMAHNHRFHDVTEYHATGRLLDRTPGNS